MIDYEGNAIREDFDKILSIGYTNQESQKREIKKCNYILKYKQNVQLWNQ